MVTSTRTLQKGPVRRSLPPIFRLGEDLPRSQYAAIAAASFILPFILWCILSYAGLVSKLILPTPSAVVVATYNLLKDGTLLPDIGISVFRIATGFLLSAILAIPTGILIGSYKGVEAANEPLIGFIRYVPVPALIPLVMVAAGIGEPAKILLIFIGTYFQMVI
ncbi:MAG: ABC transporter permease, partial [Armatimonadota bacterium]|nr:ABC transporter permease [Armatimonadota bacterium]